MSRLLCLLACLAACGSDPAGEALPDGSTPPVDATGNASRCVAEPTMPNDPLVVVTEAGELRGKQVGELTAFSGIPYAEAPVGERRFKPPAERACWQGVRDATSFGSVCPQLLPSGSRLGQEDCLFLNVVTPEARKPAGQGRPVMVFIHGGAYEFGSGNQDLVLEGSGNLYDGQTLAKEHDAVLVTINYRLGGLGFMAHPALSAEDPHGSSGNYGTLDQIAALKWVQNNIAAFGGDPERVMIFGESAGGLSVCLLLATPLARGLFSAALIESGGCQVAPQAKRFEQGLALSRRIDCADDDVACLRAAAPWQFIAQIAWDAGGWIGEDKRRGWEMLHGPNVDGYVFEEDGLASLKAGRIAKVPVIVGSNADEFGMFTPPMAFCTDYYAFMGSLWGSRADEVIREYSCFDYATPRQAAVAAMTDQMFTCEARRIARAAAEGGAPTVRRYFFTRGLSGHALSVLDAFHTVELPFVFRTFDVLRYTPSAADLELSKLMGGYWARFAATGNPNGAGATDWPSFAATDWTLQLNMPAKVVSDPRKDKCDFWDSF